MARFSTESTALPLLTTLENWPFLEELDIGKHLLIFDDLRCSRQNFKTGN